MFGYVIVNKAELKFKEFDIYQSFYCGLCKKLKENGGNVSRLALTYDMTFVYMLLTGLYEPKTVYCPCKCVLHPLEKRYMRQNEYADYVADMSVLMTCYKCRDDWNDEKKLTAKCMLEMLTKKNKYIVEKYPEKTKRIAQAMEQLSRREKAGSDNVDEMAGIFGRIMAEILVCKEDEWATVLSRMGFYLGKFIYILDAYEDIEEDKKKGHYNPLCKLYEGADFEEECRQILTMMIAECSREFEKLPILENVDILRNILYSGVWVRFDNIRTKRAAKESPKDLETEGQEEQG